MLLVLFGLLSGCALTVQSSVNARLRRSLGSPFQSSLASFAIGTAFLLVLVGAVDHSYGVADAARHAPWWVWSGGVLGVCFLTSNILLMPRLGAVETGVFPLVGQVVMGLVIDTLGLFAAPQHGLTATRGLGGLLVLAGATTVAVGGVAPQRHAQHARGAWPWRAVGVAAGMMSAAQTAINGHLGVLLGSARKSALASFTIGTLALVLLNLIARSRVSLQVPPGERGNPWWMWTGGVLGALYVAVNATLAPVLGAGMTIILSLLGMMVASVVVDHLGLLHNARRPTRPVRLLGLVGLVAGVAMIRLL